MLLRNVTLRFGVRYLSSTTVKTFVPRRACLYVPGNDLKKINKVTGLNVDCTILDCEDGVAINRKKEARETIQKVMDEFDFGRTEPIVRVNALDSGLIEQDLAVTLQVKNKPATLMLPKVETPANLRKFADLLTALNEPPKEESKFNLIIFIESAIGMLNLQDICTEAMQISQAGGPFVLEGLVFGSDDFCADIGATRSAGGRELLYARQKLVLIAKAFRLQAIDMVHIDYKDLVGLKQYALEGSMMGFTGKQCIHPCQVDIVQEAFSPSPQKVEWATELVKAFSDHQDSGKGAFTFRGHMIDMPLLLQAQNILHVSQTLNKDAS